MILYEVDENVQKAYRKGYEKANKEWQNKIKKIIKDIEEAYDNSDTPETRCFLFATKNTLENLLKGE